MADILSTLAEGERNLRHEVGGWTARDKGERLSKKAESAESLIAFEYRWVL